MELLSRMTLVDAAAASLPLDMVMEKLSAKLNWPVLLLRMPH